MPGKQQAIPLVSRNKFGLFLSAILLTMPPVAFAGKAPVVGFVKVDADKYFAEEQRYNPFAKRVLTPNGFAFALAEWRQIWGDRAHEKITLDLLRKFHNGRGEFLFETTGHGLLCRRRMDRADADGKAVKRNQTSHAIFEPRLAHGSPKPFDHSGVRVPIERLLVGERQTDQVLLWNAPTMRIVLRQLARSGHGRAVQESEVLRPQGRPRRRSGRRAGGQCQQHRKAVHERAAYRRIIDEAMPRRGPQRPRRKPRNPSARNRCRSRRAQSGPDAECPLPGDDRCTGQVVMIGDMKDFFGNGAIAPHDAKKLLPVGQIAALPRSRVFRTEFLLKPHKSRSFSVIELLGVEFHRPLSGLLSPRSDGPASLC